MSCGSTNCAQFAQGTLFKREGTTVAEVVSIGGPSMSRDVIDITSHSSASNSREFISGLINSGEVTLEVNWCPGNSSQDVIRDTDMYNENCVSYSIVWPDSDATTVTFNAYVTSFDINSPVDAQLTVSMGFQISGKPVWS